VGEVALVGGDVRRAPAELEGDPRLPAQRDLDTVGEGAGRIQREEQALEQVVAVGAATDDAEPEVQLRGRGEAQAYFDASTKRMRRS
jgi:hypothetical protein